MNRTLIVSILAAALCLTTGASQAQPQEQIYGSQIMTQQERNEYRAKMRAANTVEERERIRAEPGQLRDPFKKGGSKARSAQ